MTSRYLAFFLVRLVALLWVLALVHIADTLGVYGISFCIILSELLLGYAWGKAESRFTSCKPKTMDPRRLFVLTIVLGIAESFGALFFMGIFVPWLVVWRVCTAYVPFALAEALTYRQVCR